MALRGHYNVAPRYSSGSPALVDERTALRVAEEEKDEYATCLEGVYGPERKAKAERLGLRGISEYRLERGSGKKHGWEVHDLCTGEKFWRLCAEALEKCGWKRYHDLADWERKLIDNDPPADIPDHTKAHYKVEFASFDTSPTGYKITVYRPTLVTDEKPAPWRG